MRATLPHTPLTSPERHDLLGCDLGVGLQVHKGTGRLAPTPIRLGRHGCRQHIGMPKCASTMGGVLGNITATVSFLPMPALLNALAS